MDSSDERTTYPRAATPDDMAKLRHVADKVPPIVWLVAFIGAAQRFAYYGTTVPWQNYLQNPLDNPSAPGALGLGQSTATTINNAFLFFGYLSPLPFAIISDSWLGRYKTLLLSLIICLAGEVVLFITALPFAIGDRSTALGGIIVAMVFIGLGQGGTTAVIFPFLGDQILAASTPRVIRDKRGGIVVTDPQMTIQYVFNYFFWMINVAALSTLATTNMERKIGFWAAYLLPLFVLLASMVPFILYNGRLTKLPAQGNVLPHAGKVLALAARSGFHLSAADPSRQRTQHNREVPWTSTFVQEIRRGLRAGRVVICFTIFYLCFNQSTNNLVSQANQMELTGGISNDTIQSLNPIFYIVVNPLIQNFLLPFLSRRRVAFGPIRRITAAFALLAITMAYAAGTQQLIYSRGPCYSQPLACDAGRVSPATADTTISDNTGTGGAAAEYRPNEVSVWVQAPLHLLVAIGEIFGMVAMNELAYSEAPTNMKALVKALEQLTAALGAALGIALGPVSQDPFLVAMYAALGGAMVVTAVGFYAFFRAYDTDAVHKRGVEDSERAAADVGVVAVGGEKTRGE